MGIEAATAHYSSDSISRLPAQFLDWVDLRQQVVCDMLPPLKGVGFPGQVYPDHKIVRLLVTHYARPAILQNLKEKQIIVAQTFEL